MKFPYQLIDLTHTLENSIPNWDNSCGFNHELQLDYPDCQGEDKFRVMKLSMDAGIGTHMDAPSHCVPGAKGIHEFDVNDLCMSCVVIDVSSKAHEHYRVSAEDINDFERRYGLIRQHTCVLIKTGWERFWREPLKYHNQHVFPSVSIEAANLLLKRGVTALGIDTLSPDCPEYGFKVHQAFLGAGKILLENVANLESMPVTGALVMICPLKVLDGTEVPVRLLGLICLDSL
ncbi:cyclase family protein [Legionella lytica]|uniref:Cyclase family protein n=1 Tax=Legionella lytica TaxID=96232 RepID=A0ABW8D5F4_9GAMM